VRRGLCGKSSRLSPGISPAVQVALSEVQAAGQSPWSIRRACCLPSPRPAGRRACFSDDHPISFFDIAAPSRRSRGCGETAAAPTGRLECLLGCF
jgi:hypothetical protein